jgi:NAD-dependent dihydropyrimidine dehydrogenase PreA subunit
MYIITIDEDKCDGDGECVNTCPVEMFELQNGKSAIVGNLDECLGCESCVSVCTNGCLTLTEM